MLGDAKRPPGAHLMSQTPLSSAASTRDSTSRRQFARTLAGSALGILGMPALVLGRGGGEKLNIALVGVGGRGGDNLKSVAGENIVALCDADENRLGEAAKGHARAR